MPLNMKNSILTLLLTVCATTLTIAQSTADSPDFLRSIGKIYVVVGVIVAIFVGIVAYLFYLDRKVTRLEREYPEL